MPHCYVHCCKLWLQTWVGCDNNTEDTLLATGPPRAQLAPTPLAAASRNPAAASCLGVRQQSPLTPGNTNSCAQPTHIAEAPAHIRWVRRRSRGRRRPAGQPSHQPPRRSPPPPCSARQPSPALPTLPRPPACRCSSSGPPRPHASGPSGRLKPARRMGGRPQRKRAWRRLSYAQTTRTSAAMHECMNE